MKESAFAILSPEDWRLLRRHMSPRDFARGDHLLREGGRDRRLMVLREGSVAIQRMQEGRSIVLRELGPGEVLGEIGFVEDAPASASVVAQEHCRADVIEGDVLLSLVAAEPGFAVRFYHSLAVALAQRVRAGDAARLAALQVSHGAAPPRTGNLSPRQLPAAIDTGLQAFEREMLAARSALRRGASEAQEAGRVARACDDVATLLRNHCEDESLVEIGYSDLLAFRDNATIADGLGDAIYRETFGTFMLSTVLSRLMTRPRGFAEDFETVAHFHRNEPAGDDWTGPLIDRWFLGRPLSRSRRAAAARVASEIATQATRVGPGLRITGLASGYAAEVLLFFEQHPGADATVRCVDQDPRAQLALAQRAQAASLNDRVVCVLGSALPADDEAEPAYPQHLIFATGLCEYLDDSDVVALLDHCHARLAPGGRVVLSNLAVGQPDERVMQHLLNWTTHHRTRHDLTALWERSAFAGSPVRIELDEPGVSWYVQGERARNAGPPRSGSNAS